jgi:serine protease Do
MDRPRGIIIQGIVEGGAASESDLSPGDVILKIDGREVNRPNELQSYVAAKTAGTTVTLTLFRDGEEIERKITLKKRETETSTELASDKKNEESSESSSTSTASFNDIGLTVKNLTEKERTDFDVENGVVITDVKAFSRAEDQRLFVGLLIVEADKTPVKNVDDLSELIDAKKGSALLMKVVDNQGNTRFVGLEIPE